MTKSPNQLQFDEAALIYETTDAQKFARTLFDIAHVDGPDTAKAYFTKHVCPQFFHDGPERTWKDFNETLWPAIQSMNFSPELKQSFYALADKKHQLELGKKTRETVVNEVLAHLNAVPAENPDSSANILQNLFNEDRTQAAAQFDIITKGEFSTAAKQLDWTPERLVKFMHWRLHDEIPKRIGPLGRDVEQWYQDLYRNDPEQLQLPRPE